MKAEDFKNKTSDELQKIITDLRKEQFNMRFQRSQGTLENVARVRKVRRDIARAKTFLNQQKAGKAAPAKAAKAEKPAASKKPAAKKKAKE